MCACNCWRQCVRHSACNCWCCLLHFILFMFISSVGVHDLRSHGFYIHCMHRTTTCGADILVVVSPHRHRSHFLPFPILIYTAHGFVSFAGWCFAAFETCTKHAHRSSNTGQCAHLRREAAAAATTTTTIRQLRNPYGAHEISHCMWHRRA